MNHISWICRYSDKILANILTTKTGLCDRRFELTIDDVKFVGQPTLVQDVNTKWVRIDGVEISYIPEIIQIDKIM